MRKIALAVFSLSLVFGVFFAPASSALAQTAVQNDPYSQDFEKSLGTCTSGITINVASCLNQGYYFLILYPSSWFARITGEVFDYFLAYSIDTASYAGINNTFVERGWSIIRDIANITFIFALLYVAIAHILNISSSKTKSFLKDIIIAAILINFSLFFTKVIIDGGNILARAFYTQIEIVNSDNPDNKDVSKAIVSHIEPQKLMSSALFRPVDAPGRDAERIDPGWAFLIMILVTAVNVIIGITFLSVFLLFAARVIGLWFMMIFSPLAFASIAIPGTKGFLGKFGIGEWLKQTVSLSFMAPVFMFFLFLLIMFLEIIFTSSIPEGDQSSVQSIMSVLIPFIAVILILNMAKKQSKDMSGEVGKQVTGAVGKIAGVAATGALAVATGGAAVAGRAVIGSTAARLASSEKLKKKAANSRFYRAIHKSAVGLQDKSFDYRNTAAGKRTSALLNQTFQTATGGAGNVSLGKGTTKGGYVKRMEAYQKKKEDYAESLKSSDSAVKEAETALLRKQNDEKRKDRDFVIKNAEIGMPPENITRDYDGWNKEKEKAEKARKQAEIDFANVQRDATSTVAEKAAAKAKLKYFQERHDDINNIVKDIESEWKSEETEFRRVQKEKNIHDTKVLRDYAESTKSNNPLMYLYDMARGGSTSARNDAASNIAYKAEKSEKKAQQEEKKDEKKS